MNGELKNFFWDTLEFKELYFQSSLWELQLFPEGNKGKSVKKDWEVGTIDKKIFL